MSALLTQFMKNLNTTSICLGVWITLNVLNILGFMHIIMGCFGASKTVRFVEYPQRIREKETLIGLGELQMAYGQLILCGQTTPSLTQRFLNSFLNHNLIQFTNCGHGEINMR